jgi:hypothetical protein
MHPVVAILLSCTYWLALEPSISQYYFYSCINFHFLGVQKIKVDATPTSDTATPTTRTATPTTQTATPTTQDNTV